MSTTLQVQATTAMSIRRETAASNDVSNVSSSRIEPLQLEPGRMNAIMKRKELMYFASMCFALFLAGWNEYVCLLHPFIVICGGLTVLSIPVVARVHSYLACKIHIMSESCFQSLWRTGF